ncbi:hypothetical protein DMN91_012339 [Ooceraea biroi]|uniref:DUF4781 domain-containing protein n=1 Tax=Ooceraea biroi TaxID=2015173 RepID=A0A026VV71_OOCBI|nr:uncharacterized protein LOC105286287 [Ooceraea biroi]XP_026830389.1 uncharacterized protein LOC105286287 [Ooceraea biroi]EZA47673.1 hypothetical protein X777_15421 [Ooceraea biroi]RLU15345.1 hypothetical protein DMN91_012339 [Ooceraea biroi]
MSQTEEKATYTYIVPNELIELAAEQQQCFYECLPECTEYKHNEHEYLKRNIGYAIYGPPEIKSTNENTTEGNNSNSNSEPKTVKDADADIADSVDYSEEQKAVINKIYDKICECVIEKDKPILPIYFAIIYNIICGNEKIKPNKKDQPKEDQQVKPQAKDVADKEKETRKTDAKDEDEWPVVFIPIFTIRKSIPRQSNTANAKQEEKAPTGDETSYDTWYIDITARVYKSWSDYKENNNLPECVMILPKDGCYQEDKTKPVTEDYSTVLLEILDSPACAWTAKFAKGADIASTVLGIGGIGLCVASMFTPLAPIAIAGLAMSGATGAWTIGRSSQQLVDRSKHEESIDLFNKEAFPHWICLAGSATGLGVVGGSAALSAAAARGMAVNMVARTAFNTIQGGSIFLNGVGILYQGYCIVDKYKTDGTISYVDTLSFVAHAMFFTNSVVNIQFAGDIIESSQGRVINDYKENLRTRNLRKKFNRMRRKANENNTNSISENAEVIRYIKNRQQLSSFKQNAADTSMSSFKQNAADALTSNKTFSNVVWSFDQGKLKVNGVTLIDPFEYVMRLIRLGVFVDQSQEQSVSRYGTNDCTFEQLMKVLCNLLTKYSANRNYHSSTRLPDYEPLIRQMSSMNINEDYLKKLFDVAVRLMQRSRDVEDWLLKAMTFVWQYCKINLKQWGIETYLRERSDSGSFILRNIIIAVSEALDMMLTNLFNAFYMYVEATLHRE